MQHTPSRAPILIGTAAWSVPRAVADRFPKDGTHLERYSRVLPCAEINSSFYRPHARKVYEKWAAQTPDSFRFSVKLPKTITHEQRLHEPEAPLKMFLEQVAGLGKKLGPILVQMPASLQFEAATALAFFGLLRKLYDGAVVCEPRHAGWFEPDADALLSEHGIARVVADPSPVGVEQRPTRKHATDAVTYYRLHGSPKMYWSRYSPERIHQWSMELMEIATARDAWCIFDNTASGAAIQNALEMTALVADDTPGNRAPRLGVCTT